jgi:hypothetical protein
MGYFSFFFLFVLHSPARRRRTRRRNRTGTVKFHDQCQAVSHIQLPPAGTRREQGNAASNPRQASLRFSLAISHSTHALANPLRLFLPFSFFFGPFQPSSPPKLLLFPRFRCSSRTSRSRKEPILSCCWRFCFLSSLGS